MIKDNLYMNITHCTHCTLVYFNLPISKVWHLFERVDWDKHRTNICLGLRLRIIILHNYNYVQFVRYCEIAVPATYSLFSDSVYIRMHMLPWSITHSCHTHTHTKYTSVYTTLLCLSISLHTYTCIPEEGTCNQPSIQHNMVHVYITIHTFIFMII